MDNLVGFRVKSHGKPLDNPEIAHYHQEKVIDDGPELHGAEDVLADVVQGFEVVNAPVQLFKRLFQLLVFFFADPC